MKKLNTIALTAALTAAVMSMAAFSLGKSMPDKEKYINMETVVDFDATETGLMLYTSDGSGYYWEREAN